MNSGDSSFGRELNWYHRRHGIESRSSQALKSYLLNCVDNCYDICMSSYFLVCFLKYENTCQSKHTTNTERFAITVSVTGQNKIRFKMILTYQFHVL